MFLNYNGNAYKFIRIGPEREGVWVENNVIVPRLLAVELTKKAIELELVEMHGFSAFPRKKAEEKIPRQKAQSKTKISLKIMLQK